jgi:hypothetical protein
MPDFDPQQFAYLLGSVGAVLWIFNQTMLALNPHPRRLRRRKANSYQ